MNRPLSLVSRCFVALLLLASVSSGLAADGFPQHLDPAGIVEQTITLGSDYPLPATITRPADRDAYPVVVMLSGSGPNDRDGTIGPNKVYRDIAWGLANRGIASLRFAKRTREYGLGDAAADPGGFGYIEWEYADDAALAIDLARNLPGATSVILLGHSLGATVAPRIATENGVDALVMIAGSARRFAQVSIDQNRYLASRMEQSEQLEQQLAGLVAFFESVLRHEVPAATPVQPGLPVAYYYALDEYQPQDYLPSFPGPVLVTQGDADFQTLPDADYGVLRARFSGDPRFTFRLFEGLHHLLMPATSRDAGAANYARPGYVDAEFLEFLADWINERET